MKIKIIEIEGQKFIHSYDKSGVGYVAHVVIETNVSEVEEENIFDYLQEDLEDSGELDAILNQ